MLKLILTCINSLQTVLLKHEYGKILTSSTQNSASHVIETPAMLQLQQQNAPVKQNGLVTPPSKPIVNGTPRVCTKYSPSLFSFQMFLSFILFLCNDELVCRRRFRP